MSEAIGIMEGAFFVGRGELIDWANETFQLNLTRIEQFGSGAVYCQILDAVHPGKVNMARVNFNAQLEWEFVNNFKVLQQSFLKCRLNKHIDIERLSKAKYQDNLEFAQWMKRYYDINGGSNKDYDPVARRTGVVNFEFGSSKPVKQHIFTPKVENTKAVTLKPRREEKENSNIFKSHSPAAKKLEAKNKSNLLNKDKGLGKEDDAKILFKYLMEMKDIIKEDASDEQKLEELEKLVEKGLDLKMFETQKRKETKTNSLVVKRGGTKIDV